MVLVYQFMLLTSALTWNLVSCQFQGLVYRPNLDASTTLIRFVKGEASTFTPYVNHLDEFLKYYEYYEGYGGIVDCQSIAKMRDEVCRFDITYELGNACVKEQAYGYEDAQPCILLNLKNIVDWVPLPYTNETVPAEIADMWTEYAVTVKCEGENPSDRDNMGDLIYFPPNGFHFKYFPYRNQQGYRSPLVFVRFDNPSPAHLLMITCKVYAKNILHNRMLRAGMVHFELMVD